MKLSVFYEHIADASKQTGKSIAEICKLVRSYGIEAVEIEAWRLDQAETIAHLTAGPLSVNCVYAFFDFGYDTDFRKGLTLVDTAKKAGADKILVIPGFMKQESDLDSVRMNMKSALTEICSYAKDQGITVGMEDFDSTAAPFATTGQLLWFMENVPGITCTFDTGNFLFSEEDALAALTTLAPYIAHIHCKDRSFEINTGEEPKATTKGRNMYSAPVGYGCIPMQEILNYLRDMGYSGSFAIEHFGACNQLECMKKSAEWLLSR